jgi:hypothetical protein
MPVTSPFTRVVLPFLKVTVLMGVPLLGLTADTLAVKVT